MAKAIRSLNFGGARRIIGTSALGIHGSNRGSPKQQVHDGDTINVELKGNLGVRFLGIDTPEVSFMFPGTQSFVKISDQRWIDYLNGTFTHVEDLRQNLGNELADFLEPKLCAQTAINHAKHANSAENALEAMIIADMAEQGKTKDDFLFFHSFSHEVMDTFGRMLCFSNRDQPQAPRPHRYNERMLEAGATSPYFIWPNVNPFRPLTSKIEAVPTPGNIIAEVSEDNIGLKKSREWVKTARTNASEGSIFVAGDPLMLEPFELRFLARQSLPSRWVIDLANDTGTLLRPGSYHTIPFMEDRLFIPAEFVPLFTQQGWQLEAEFA